MAGSNTSTGLRGLWREGTSAMSAVFGFRAASAKPAKVKKDKKRRKAAAKPAAKLARTRGDMDARAAVTRKLASEGYDCTEIARLTRLSQDTVAMLLNISTAEPVESSGSGTFFRILQTRMEN